MPLVPRTTTACLDLAVTFYGRHLDTVLRVTLAVGLVSCAAAWWIAYHNAADLRWMIVIAYAGTLFQGLGLAMAVAPGLLGRPVGVLGGLGIVQPRLPGLLFSTAFVRSVAFVGPALVLFSGTQQWGLILLGAVLSLWPCAWLAVRAGFDAERAVLKSLDERWHDDRARRLLREEAGELFGRAVGICTFCLLVWVVVFLSLDFGLTLFTHFETLTRRFYEVVLQQRSDLLDGFWYALTHDPVVETTAVAAVFLVYPVGRLAWLFCYIDVRVRKDLWDLQIEFADEVARLKDAGA